MTDTRIDIKSAETAYQGWSRLIRFTFDYLRSDGNWQRLVREVHDHGDGATVLLTNRAAGTILLVRQFRMPPHHRGDQPFLLETPAGLLDETHPEDTIRREAEEETGVHVGPARHLWTAYMSPGAVAERVYFFHADYSPDDRRSAGGGLVDEGEDIEIVEVRLTEALEMIRDGRIVDGKTIMLVHYAAMNGLCG